MLDAAGPAQLRLAFGYAMKTDFEARVRAVRWSDYAHPCRQDQSLIPGLLFRMVQGTDEQMVKAAEELWNIAAHQGNSGPSAVPVSKFLFEMLEEQPPSVQVENLDMLYQFSVCLMREHWSEWSAELRTVFLKALPLLERLSKSSHEDIADFSGMIIKNIRDSDGPKAELGAPPNRGPADPLGNSGVGGVRHR